MKFLQDMKQTYQRVRSTGMDAGRGWTVVFKEHVLPALQAEIVALGNTVTPQTMKPVLDSLALDVDQFAADVGLPANLLSTTVAQFYPEIAHLWQSPTA